MRRGWEGSHAGSGTLPSRGPWGPLAWLPGGSSGHTLLPGRELLPAAADADRLLDLAAGLLISVILWLILEFPSAWVLFFFPIEYLFFFSSKICPEREREPTSTRLVALTSDFWWQLSRQPGPVSPESSGKPSAGTAEATPVRPVLPRRSAGVCGFGPVQLEAPLFVCSRPFPANPRPAGRVRVPRVPGAQQPCDPGAHVQPAHPGACSRRGAHGGADGRGARAGRARPAVDGQPGLGLSKGQSRPGWGGQAGRSGPGPRV